MLSSLPCLDDRGRGGPAGGSPGEQATAEERSLERSISVHAASAEASDFPSGVDAEQRRPVRSKHARGKIGLKPAERLASEDVEAHGDQRPGGRIEQTMRLCDTNQPASEVTPPRSNRLDLRVFGRCANDRLVAAGDLLLELGGVEERLVRQGVHAADEITEVVGADEVRAVLFERLNRRRSGLRNDPLEEESD